METKRIKFDKWRKALVVHLYNNYDGGSFRRLHQDKSCSKNMEKGSAWEKFTIAYNEVIYFHNILTARLFHRTVFFRGFLYL
jgi:hypothetical protein